MQDVELRDVPEQLVVTEQRNVAQAQLEEWLPGAMGRVASAAADLGGVLRTDSQPWLRRDGHPAAQVFVVIYEGNPNEGPCPVEVCALVAGDRAPNGAATRRVPAHREAYVRLTKADTQPTSRLGAVYEMVERWISERGMEVAAAPREVYYADY